MMTNSISMISRRLKRFYESMESHGWDAALITGKGNLRYFTDFRLNRVASAILVIPRAGEAFYFVAKLDFERAKRDCPNFEVISFPEDTPSYLDGLGQIIGGNTIRHLAIESNLLYQQARYINKLLPEAAFFFLDETLLKFRAIKDLEEIARLRKAAQIADRAMTGVIQQVAVGKTELELVGLAKLLFAQEGGEDESFEPFLMSGENAWLPQRVATDRTIREGELIIFDMGTIYRGYCSDLTRTFSLGVLTSEQKKVYQIALAAQQKAIEAIRPGIEAQEIDKVARSYIEERGFGRFFPHLTGHGIGVEDHEEPIIDQGNTLLLEENMVLTIEPGLYVPGVGAARLEDMVLVTPEGAELLTSAPKESM